MLSWKTIRQKNGGQKKSAFVSIQDACRMLRPQRLSCTRRTIHNPTSHFELPMRYLAQVSTDLEIKRLMVCVDRDGACLLFCYDSEFDTSCIGDDWFENEQQAFDYCRNFYSAEFTDWFVVGATAPHCQDDWIAAVRIPGRETGNPQWGRLQLFMNGQWTELDMEALPKIEIDYSRLKRRG